MDQVAIFSDDKTAPRPLKLRPFASEAELRRFAESRLGAALAINLIATEVSVEGWASGRIDALAVDGRLRPIVLEFKREATGGAIGQALVYLDWLCAHRDAVALPPPAGSG